MLILKGLVDPICTKIVQVSQVLRIKGLGRVVGPENKNASKDAGATPTVHNYI